MILIRHSIPEQLPSVSSSEWQLSAVGRARCASLARELEPFQPDAIFSSVERKAAETAQLIAQHFGLQVVQLRELAEHDRSNVPYFASQEEFEEHLHQFFEQPERRVFGQESAVEALSRFERGIDVVR